MVYVISKSGKPLMPCENVIARLLLKSGKAKVKRREPFTIKLTYETTEYTQPLTLGVDTGSGTAGFAVANEKNEIVYRSEVVVRNDIKHKMDERRTRRKFRRTRKTRYRQSRFDNRGNSKRKGRINPTLISKIHSHEKEIEFIKSILPISQVIIELGKFDPAAMQNPSLRNSKIIHWGYQKGLNYRFANTKAKVRFRDNNECQICHGKSKDHRLNVHHIIFKSNNGSDHEDNLITLCESCHKKLHNGEIKTKFIGKTKGDLNHATHMNIISSVLSKKYPNFIETWGYITSANRLALGLNKYSHWLDASVIATGGRKPIFKTIVFYIKKCNANGSYKRTTGKGNKNKIPNHKIMGFLRYDKVKYADKLCFIKGCRSRGDPELMDISGKKLYFSYLPKGIKTPKFIRMKRITARSSWMVWTQREWKLS